MWELAHRTRAESASTMVQSNVSTSAAAIAEVRAAIPEDHVILYVERGSHQAVSAGLSGEL